MSKTNRAMNISMKLTKDVSFENRNSGYIRNKSFRKSARDVDILHI